MYSNRNSNYTFFVTPWSRIHPKCSMVSNADLRGEKPATNHLSHKHKFFLKYRNKTFVIRIAYHTVGCEHSKENIKMPRGEDFFV
jgi:hypothetical protein